MTMPRLIIVTLIPLFLSGCIALDAAEAVGSAAGTAVSAGSTVVGAGAKTVGAAADALQTQENKGQDTRKRHGE